MIPRYEQVEITKIWSDENKVILWQRAELAVIKAVLGETSMEIYLKIRRLLLKHPIDIGWWKNREKEINHDLDAFIDERKRFLPPDLQHYLHEELTSYDTEEPAFAFMLKESIRVVEKWLCEFTQALKEKALKYRYTIMMGRTHGQEAELQTFGKRCLTWLRGLMVDIENLQMAKKNLRYSKLSGAIGNYGGIDPELEKTALRKLGFKPFYGATQIMPRELYTPLAQSFCQIVVTLDKIATDIRLGARSGQPIYQEPFGKKQKGSSRMPHKENTISTEQMEGMARMARNFHSMILENIKTWEERAIEQSSVERVAWPNLFHIVIHSLKTMTRVLNGLAVYPDNMLLEVIESRGCYATGEAKKFLGNKGAVRGFIPEEAYRMVQLAAFNVFEPGFEAKQLRENPPTSLAQADEILLGFQKLPRPLPISIEEVLLNGKLQISSQLEATEADVERWNNFLKNIFCHPLNRKEFSRMFSVPHLLRNETRIYQEILRI